MVLRAGKMQGVGHRQGETGTQQDSLQKDRFRQTEGFESLEQRFITALQNGVAPLDGSNQAFQFHQR